MMPEISIEAKETKVVGYCTTCGNEIYEDESWFSGNAGMIHDECIWDFLKDEIGIVELASMCGYRMI